jgi:hypothetical protein
LRVLIEHSRDQGKSNLNSRTSSFQLRWIDAGDFSLMHIFMLLNIIFYPMFFPSLFRIFITFPLFSGFLIGLDNFLSLFKKL